MGIEKIEGENQPVQVASELMQGLGAMYTTENLLDELEAQLKPTKRWSFWADRIEAIRLLTKRDTEAFEDQTRELEIAVGLLEELGQAHEYRCRAYPKLYKRVGSA